MSASPDYDLVLFGATGFTGKLCLRYILSLLQKNPKLIGKWAISGRSASRLEDAFKSACEKAEIMVDQVTNKPALLTANLVFEDCDTKGPEELRKIVKNTKVVLTTAGPFAKYGLTLAKFCAELGTDYADISGETDYMRELIELYDDSARSSGARILMHCGCDCIPWDLSFVLLDTHAKKVNPNVQSKSLRTYCEGAGSFSGGTMETVYYHAVEKPKKKGQVFGFDPLYKLPDGSKTTHVTKVEQTSAVKFYKEINTTAGPWIMSPVMGNCVRRTNALLKLSSPDFFSFRDVSVQENSLVNKLKLASFAASFYVAPWRWFMRKYILPSPGEGPSEEEMDNGHLTLTSFLDVVDVETGKSSSTSTTYKSVMKFYKDVGYKDTARMLVETGLTLLLDVPKQKKQGGEEEDVAIFKGLLRDGGVLTPGSALGPFLLQRLQSGGTTFEVEKADVSEAKGDDPGMRSVVC